MPASGQLDSHNRWIRFWGAGQGGGTTSDTFTFAVNPRNPAPGYNIWAKKTTQTLPNGAQIIVYTNYASLPMLKVYIDPNGTSKWMTFYRYNASAQMIWEAQPSAVSGYDDTNDDLLNFNSGTGLYQYLNNTTGLIKVTDYFSTTGSGAVAGYVDTQWVQQGQQGNTAGHTKVKTRSYTYTSNSGGGVTAYFPASVIDYPDAITQTTTITTSFSYTFYTGTNQIQQRTTMLPTVASGQNGSGNTVTRVEQFDSYGNLTQITDERGTVNKFVYDVVTGAKTQQTLNYLASPTGAAGENLLTFSFPK